MSCPVTVHVAPDWGTGHEEGRRGRAAPGAPPPNVRVQKFFPCRKLLGVQLPPCHERYGLARHPGRPRHGCVPRIGRRFATRNPTPSASTVTVRSTRPTGACATSRSRRQTSVLGAPARPVTAPASSRSASTPRGQPTRSRRAPSVASSRSERSRRRAQRVAHGRRLSPVGLARAHRRCQGVAFLTRGATKNGPGRRASAARDFRSPETRTTALPVESARSLRLPRLPSEDHGDGATERRPEHGQGTRLLRVVRATEDGRSVRESGRAPALDQVDHDERERGLLQRSSGRHGLNDLRPEDLLGFILLFIAVLAFGLAQ